MDFSKVNINFLAPELQAEYKRLPDNLNLEDIAKLWADDKSKQDTIKRYLLDKIKQRKLQIFTCEKWEKGYLGLCVRDGEIIDFEELLDRMGKRSAVNKDYKKEVMEKLINGELIIPYIPSTVFIITNDSNPLSKMNGWKANQVLKIFTPDPLPAHIKNLPCLSEINNLTIHKDDFKQWAMNAKQWPIKNCLLANWWPGESTKENTVKNQNTTPGNQNIFGSCLLNAPKRQDDWFDLINDMANEFYNTYKKLPNKTQAWGQLCENSPHGYRVTIDKDKGEDCLIMHGLKPLLISAFYKRWNNYTENKTY